MMRIVLCVSVALVALSTLLLSEQPAHCNGCIDNWTAGNRAAHSGCQAGPIDPGIPYYNGPYPWRWHHLPFSKPADTDKDCHRKTNCTYEDVSENAFTCNWIIQKYTDGNWVTIGATIESNCAGCDWWDTAREPDKEYRAGVSVDDTPNDSPHGDDEATEYHYSSSITLRMADLTDYHLLSGWPQCNVWAQDPTEAVPQGHLGYRYGWSSTCGAGETHVMHLDTVTVREKVMYDGYTSNKEHDTRHNGDTPFWGTVDDPTIWGLSGTEGLWADDHYVFAWVGPCQGADSCTGHQLYQWAKQWPDAPKAEPLPDDPPVDWHTVGDYNIERSVVGPNEDGKWRYKIHKDSGPGECHGPFMYCGT